MLGPRMLLMGLLLLSSSLADVKGRRPNKKRQKMLVPAELGKMKAELKTLTEKMAEMEATNVNVNVYGEGEVSAHAEQESDGTHVHIHMHMEHDEDKHDMHFDPSHADHMHWPSDDEYVYAHCELQMSSTQTESKHNIQGAVHFRQKMNGPLEMVLHITGFYDPPEAKTDHSLHMHGFHVHQYGDLSNGCKACGGHFNPDNVNHSAHDADSRHAGDWGNISCDDKGEVHTNRTDNHTSILGTHSILGRGIVIHEGADDLGTGGSAASLKSGDAGGRLACCTVALSGPHDWDVLNLHMDDGHGGHAGHHHDHADHSDHGH